LYGWMRVRECGRFQRSFYRHWNDDLFQGVLDYFRLDPQARVRNLSRGERAGLCLALTLAPEPEVLMLDDPAQGLDPVARRELWNLLFELAAKDVTLLVTTHYMDEAERCGTVGFLYQSRLLVAGKPAELVALPEVTPAGMRRVEAECDLDVAALMAHARGLPYVEEVTIFGNSLHLLIDATVPDARIARDLEAGGGSAVRIRPIDAALEDVFVRLTKLQEARRNGERAEVRS